MSIESKQRVIIVAGPPGSGKGTQCKRLSKKYGFRHISTGDIFRDAMMKGTELGKTVAPYIQKGHFVPDDLVIALIEEYVQAPESLKQGVLLDGFPRTASQARALAASKVEIERFILLQTSDAICVERCLGRRTDPDDGKIYHLKFSPPKQEISDRLVRREFDVDEKTIRVRLQVYYAQLGLMLPYFRGKIQVVNGARKVKQVSAEFDKCLQTKPDPVEIKDAPVSPAPAAAPAPAPAPAVPQCSVCYDAAADHLVIPCGHQCGCKACLTAIEQESGACPICRGPIQGLVKVFLVTQDDDNNSGGGGGYVSAATGQAVAMKDAKVAGVVAIGGELHPGDVKKLKKIGVADDGGWGEDEDEEEGDEKAEKKEDKEALQVSIAPCEDLDSPYQSDRKVDVAVLIDVPDLTLRRGVDVCCVVDVSGSMGSAASYEDPDTKQVTDDGLSILDVVKHAVKTVIHLLKPEDRFSLVSFDEKAETAFALGEMTDGIKKQALTALDGLQPRGNTSIWAGLLAGLDSLRMGSPDKDRRKFILVLTDGQPNIAPPRGHEVELLSYFESHPGFGVQVNTFGFGYNLNSDILLGLASTGNGTYAFIPDSKIVGTCFVNSVANAISTLAPGAQLHLMPSKGATVIPLVGDKNKLSLPGGIPLQEVSWGFMANLGPMTYGNRYEVVVPMKLADHKSASFLEAILVYKDRNGKEVKITAHGTKYAATPESVFGGARSKVITEGFQVISDALNAKGAAANKNWAAVAGAIAALELANKDNARMVALNEDVKGRMSKALTTKERFNRWGKHYLRALIRAHQLQQCTNFMDPGLQLYGGTLFKEVSEAGGKIFVSIPLPTPSLGKKVVAQPAAAPVAGGAPKPAPALVPVLPAPAAQDYYQGNSGGCFSGSSAVTKLIDGKEIQLPISNLRKGDQVKVSSQSQIGPNSSYASVRYLVKIQRPQDKPLLRFQNSGLTITPNHPIRIQKTWVLPSSLPSSTQTSHDGYVYNVILDASHILLVNDIECITWGHQMKGDVIYHSFYGGSSVVENVQALAGRQQQQGAENEVVEVSGTWRNQHGQVVGLW